MKSTLTRFASLAVVLALGACATTSGTTDVSSDGPPPRGHGKGDFLEVYDLNDDGIVSTSEFVSARNKGFDARDRDGNGTVIEAEYVGEYEVRLDQQLAERRDLQLKQAYVRFGVLDPNEDGIITREEFQKSGMNMFSRLDADGNGTVNDADDADRY